MAGVHGSAPPISVPRCPHYAVPPVRAASPARSPSPAGRSSSPSSTPESRPGGSFEPSVESPIGPEPDRRVAEKSARPESAGFGAVRHYGIPTSSIYSSHSFYTCDDRLRCRDRARSEAERGRRSLRSAPTAPSSRGVRRPRVSEGELELAPPDGRGGPRAAPGSPREAGPRERIPPGGGTPRGAVHRVDRRDEPARAEPLARRRPGRPPASGPADRGRVGRPGIYRTAVFRVRMCDLPEEELAEYLLWLEAAAVSRARPRVLSERERRATELVASPAPEPVSA